MIKLILMLLLALGASSARADYPADMSGKKEYGYYHYSTTRPYFATKVEMCDDAEKYENANFKTTYGGYKPNGYAPDWGLMCITEIGGYNGPLIIERIAPKCPYGGTYTTTGNMCLGANAPPPACPHAAGTKFDFTIKTGTGPVGAPFATNPTQVGFPTSSPLCGLSGVPSVKRCYGTTTGTVQTFYCEFSGTSNGQPVPAGTGPTADAPPAGAPLERTNVPPMPPPAGSSSCPGGTVQGGIDSSGTPICFGTGTDPANPKPTSQTTAPTVTQSNPDGSNTETTTTTQKNSDGSTTTTTVKKTTDASGAVTISAESQTSVKPATGEAGKQDTAEDKNDLCARNPMLSICRNSSVAGTCGAITCVGDAIQCATLRATALMQCAQDANKAALEASPSKTLGASILSGSDPMKGAIDANLAGTTVNLSNPNLDSSGFLGASSCLSDRSFDVMGQSVSVSFATVCDNITPLRYLVMSVASIVAYLILAKSVIG